MKRKRLYCPECGARLIDAAWNNNSELRAEQNIRGGWKADYYQKCNKCKKQIGIRKVS